jgi:AhpD family alkylhydroperoxidase
MSPGLAFARRIKSQKRQEKATSGKTPRRRAGLSPAQHNPGSRCLPSRQGERIMMMDWTAYQQQLKGTIGEIAKLSPETIRGYVGLSAAGQKTGHLDAKTRELVAFGVAISLRCDGCIVTHTDAAIKQGATKEEIAEALGVAITVNAGAALIYPARVMDAYATLKSPG